MNASLCLQKVNAFLFPETCYVCFDEVKTSSLRLCECCTENLHTLTKEERFHFQNTYLNNISSAYIQYNFTNEIQQLIHKIKYENGKKLAESLGYSLAVAFPEISEYDILIPCPLHPKKKKEREYNQAFHICKGIQKKYPLVIDQEIVRRAKYTQTQTKLSKAERAKNLKDVFLSINKSEYKKALLVDDVSTTGTTFNNIAESIKKKNIHLEISCVAIATPLL